MAEFQEDVVAMLKDPTALKLYWYRHHPSLVSTEELIQASYNAQEAMRRMGEPESAEAIGRHIEDLLAKIR